MESQISNTPRDVKISIVLPCWNRGYVINHCISAILDQSFEDFELIIVDDGSTDNTEQVIKSFKDDRIKYYKISHTGKIGKVRNYGNERAQGELIVVQDSDDISLPDRLEVIWREYQLTNADVLYHSVYWTAAHNNGVVRNFKRAEPFDKDKLIRSQYITAHIATKRQVALDTPYDEEIHMCDDWMFLLDLACKGYAFHLIDQSLYEYWYSPDSANVAGELQGFRDKDMQRIMQTMKDKYNVQIDLTIVLNGT